MTPEENLARITEEVNEQMRRFGYILPETNQKLLEAQTGIQNFGFKVQIATGIMGNLAEAVGVTRQTIMAIENGKYFPSLELAFLIAQHFGTPLDAVFRFNPKDK